MYVDSVVPSIFFGSRRCAGDRSGDSHLPMGSHTVRQRLSAQSASVLQSSDSSRCSGVYVHSEVPSN